MALAEYARKRDFNKTAEPAAVRAKNAAHRFVIQKHAASRLHYDFRLELDGVLKSWAVPKGVPYAKGEKRLAVQVEDHPVSYLDFEGTIPKGQYGGGTVMVWDQGTFTAQSQSPLQDLQHGKLHFTLRGKKLHGEWYLVQLRGQPQWLLIKSGNDLKPISTRADNTSALSGKSMAQLSKNGRVWQSQPRQLQEASKPKSKIKTKNHAAAVGTVPSSGKFIQPMKALLRKSPPAGNDWIYEIKFDGFRALALADGHNVRLLSRNEKSFSDKFPEIVEALRELNLEAATLDGEIVALDAKGRSSFQLLQAFEMGQERPPIYYYVFDLLRFKGQDSRAQTLLARKAQLEKLLSHHKGLVRYSASLKETAGALLKRAQKLGLEGLIAKRKDSLYEAGERSGAWIKLKFHQEQEMVIGGYTNPEGARQHFGALLLGFYRGSQLHFCGKVGTGFNDKTLAHLHDRFSGLGRNSCPFVNLPEKHAGPYGAGVTAAEMKRCHWLEPKLVSQVKFSEWTRDDKLRQPVFLGLREDKDSREVVRERPK